MIFIQFYIFFLILFFIGGFFGAPWLPTNKKDFFRINKLMDIKENNVIYDLGCGNSSFLCFLVENNKEKNIKIIGIEVSPILYLYSLVKTRKYPEIKIKYGSALRYNLSNADVIYIFLTVGIYKKVKKKFEKKLKKNCKIILACWPMEGWKSNNHPDSKELPPYYLYKKGANHEIGAKGIF